MTEFQERSNKRQKIEKDNAVNHQHVTRPDQIQNWLAFRQSTDSAVKDGVNAFRNYLTGVTRLESAADRSKQLQILKQYCEWQRAASDGQLNFHDILSTWSLAVDNHGDAILSAIPSALAQFLRTISGILELRVFGLGLIDSLLRRDQSKLLEKCLASPRSKPHLASPCLRLLTEMVSFDAGARAGEIWYRKDLFMQRFDVVLEHQNLEVSFQERRNLSVRRIALRLLISMLKYLDSAAKTSLLVQVRVLHACIKGLVRDGDDIVVDVLNAIKHSLIDDAEIPRSALKRFFNSAHLEGLAVLYKFEAEDGSFQHDAVREALQSLLMKLCTTEKGVLVQQKGWYPPSSFNHALEHPEADYLNLGLDSPDYFDNYIEKVPVFNNVLATFIQKLRPYEDMLQSDLLLETFRTAPELIADYFTKRKQAPAPDSDDLTWRSHFAFLFAVIECKLPKYCGWPTQSPPIPPPATIVVESILPRSLDRAYLGKMLSSKDEVLQLSALRTITVAMKKLDEILLSFAEQSSRDAYLWEQARNKLSELVEPRIPTIREVLLTLQHASSSKTSLYTALLECLLTYHKILPDVSAATTFDIGPTMNDLCTKIEVETDHQKSSALIEQLTYAVEIADLSTTKWLRITDAETLSPALRLLRVVITSDKSSETLRLRRVLRKVLTRRGILIPSPSTFTALCSSLTVAKKFVPSMELFLFIDNCSARASSKPVKYLDENESAVRLLSDKKPLSLLVAAVADQWSFAVAKYKEDKKVIKNIAAWIARFFTLLDSSGENYRVMIHFQDCMLSDSPGKAEEYLKQAFQKVRKHPVEIDAEYKMDDKKESQLSNPEYVQESTEIEEFLKIQKHATITHVVPFSLAGLDKWLTDLDIEFEIQTKRLQRLILCVASSDEEIRLQAHQLLQQVTHIIETNSAYEGKEQVYLVLGELCESINRYGITNPLPINLLELANALLDIVVDPNHSLFSKANKFLLHKPSWSPKGVLLFWISKICTNPPERDESGTWNTEVEWLLQWLLVSLREESDLSLYRRTDEPKLWEIVLSMYSSPCLSSENKTLVLALILRGFSISRGSETLWTRFGTHSWLTIMQVTHQDKATELRLLQKKMEDSCNVDDVQVWIAKHPSLKSKNL